MKSIFLVSVAVSFAAILFGARFLKPFKSMTPVAASSAAAISTGAAPAPAPAPAAAAGGESVADAHPPIPNPNPFPTYFISHGGPNFIYKTKDNLGAYTAMHKLGKHIEEDLKPDYIVVVSAHWQSSGSNLVEIATPPAFPSQENPSAPRPLDLATENQLVYDFYGFPKHMYREEFHTKTSVSISKQIKARLEHDNFRARLTPRGIDHGVWVPFKVGFSSYTTKTDPQPANKGWELPNTKLIQVSLTSNEKDFDTHFKLGKTLDYFRQNQIWDEEEGRYLKGLVVCSGMSVHNLRDLWSAYEGMQMPYTKPFADLLADIVLTNKGDDYLTAFNELHRKHSNLMYSAHPTLEHLVPIVVAAGIASQSPDTAKPKELYNEYAGSAAWGFYEFST